MKPSENTVESSEIINIPLKIKKRRTFFGNLKDYFEIFADNTGIHGCIYIAEQHRSNLEKIAWLLIFCISLYLGILLIMQQYFKWETTPVIVSFSKTPTPVWKIPYPAVTICPETKSKQQIYNFTENYYRYKNNENFTSDEIKQFASTCLVCDETHVLDRNQSYLSEYFDLADPFIHDFLIEIAPGHNDTFTGCYIFDEEIDCRTIFRRVITEEGICYTYNMLTDDEIFTNRTHLPFYDDPFNKKKSKGWNLDSGYEENAGLDVYPRRVLSSGKVEGTHMALKTYKKDMDYVCRGVSQGYKIVLHNPAEFPRVSKQYLILPFSQVTTANIRPEIVTTSERLRNYSPRDRQCYFSDERELYFFKIYTQQHCQIECLTNFTLATCGCVAYHMPYEADTKICGIGRQNCIFSAESEFLRQELSHGILHKNNHKSQHDISLNCNCLPSCTSIVYKSDTTDTDFLHKEFLAKSGFNFSIYQGAIFSRFEIFFKQQQFITSERNELYGLIDFLANCGGLLGLFTGFSFLSLCEIFYFLTFRLACNIRKNGKQYWAGTGERDNKSLTAH